MKRTASTPMTGAVRSVGWVSLLGILAQTYLAPKIGPDMAALTAAGVAGIVVYVGKVARNLTADPEFSRSKLIHFIRAAGLIGCLALLIPMNTLAEGRCTNCLVGACTSAQIDAFAAPKTPTNFTASDSTSTSQVDLACDTVPGVTYEFYRDGVVLGTSATCAFADTSALHGVFYEYTVTASNINGTSLHTQANSGALLAIPPTSVMATNNLTGIVNISFTSAQGAIGQSLWRSATDDFAAATLVSMCIPCLSVVQDIPPMDDTNYWWFLKTIDETSTSGESLSAVGKSGGTIAQPTNMMAADGTSETIIALSCTAPQGAMSFVFTRDATPLPAQTTCAYDDTPPAHDTQYSYTVVASNVGGNSIASAADTGFLKAATPTGISATTNSSADVTLTWVEACLDVCSIYRNTTPVCTGAALATGQTGTSYVDIPPVDDTSYYYCVQHNDTYSDGDRGGPAVGMKISTPSGTLYYFSSSEGDDTWDGTTSIPGAPNGPKATTGALVALLPSLSPGDAILLKRGDTWTGAIDLSYATSGPVGTAARPITIGAYGAGALPKFDVGYITSIIKTRGSNTAAIDYLVIQDLQLTTTASPGSRPMGINLQKETVRTYNSNHITLRRLVINGLTDGIVNYSANTIIENSQIYNNYKIAPESGGNQTGIYNGGDNVIIRNNVMTDNGNPTDALEWNIYNSHNDGTLITGNTITGGPSGIKNRTSNNTTISGNTLSNFNFTAITSGGESAGGTSDTVLIENNSISDTPNGIIIKSQSGSTSLGQISNYTVRNNILHGPNPSGQYGGYVTFVDSAPNNIQMYNNTITGVANGHRAIYGTVNLTNSLIKNNILQREDNTAAIVEMSANSLAGIDLDNNLYYCVACNVLRVSGTNYATLETFKAAYAEEVSGQAGNPSFFSSTDFHLTAGSTPALNNGAIVTVPQSYDFDSVARPLTAPWDIGAYEYVP